MLQTSERPSCVYVAADESGWHKIGHTRDPKLREYHLGRDRGCPVKMVHVEAPRPHAERVEVAAHWLLADRENAREWFLVDERTALEAVREAIAKVDAGHIPHQRFAYVRRTVLREEMDARVKAALRPNESKEAFIREAVEKELKRRERR